MNVKYTTIPREKYHQASFGIPSEAWTSFQTVERARVRDLACSSVIPEYP